jgi:hypothetical protein
MKRLQLFVVLALSFVTVSAQTKWFDPLDGTEPNIQGRAWNAEIGKCYHRFPARAESQLRKPVWNLSKETAGLYVKFYTNAPEVTVKYTVSGGLSLPNMTTIAVSGVDMYATDVDGVTNWCACPGNYNFGKAAGDTIVFHYKDLTCRNTKRGNEYQLFLPLYNAVTSMKIGVPDNATFTFASLPKEKPVVIYGTSITQGASASRPAMAWTNIVQRRTQYPVINLGFSGNALMDAAVYDLLSEIDAKMYILDCMPNMVSMPDSIVSRTLAGVHKLRQKSQAPILLVENDGYLYGKTNKPAEESYKLSNRELKKAYDQLVAEGVKDLYYLTKEDIGLTPDAQVDGWHASDIGMELYADAYVKKMNDMLNCHPMAMFPPIPQRRDGYYEWETRHNQVIELNRTTNPEILLIGNSITHYWAGLPYDSIHRGPVSWKKLFGKKHVTNMGFGWDRVENVFWRIYHGELEGCAPKHIFLMIGTNNISKGDPDDKIVEGILGLVNLIRERQPQAKIHVVKIYPRHRTEQRIAGLNALLEQKLQVNDHVDIVDVTSQLLLKDGSGKLDESLFVDGTHPNEAGYSRIAEVYKKFLK